MELGAGNLNLIALQDRNAELGRDIQNAARDIREQVRREIQQSRSGANQTPPAAPNPPFPLAPNDPQVIITPDRHQIIVGGTQVPPFGPEQIPPEAVDMALGFFFTVAVIIIGLPISRAFARRMDRKAAPSQIPAEVSAQLGQLTQAVDAIALEIERISEGQRFTTRLLSEQRDAARHALSAGPDR